MDISLLEVDGCSQFLELLMSMIFYHRLLDHDVVSHVEGAHLLRHGHGCGQAVNAAGGF